MEDILRDSDRDWTVIRPPQLKDKPLSGTYRTAPEQNLRGGTLISRANVAHLMLRVIEQPETIRQAVGIASWQGAATMTNQDVAERSIQEGPGQACAPVRL
jgi:putative NADH-flavin reductase